MKSVKKVLWGIVIIAAGVLLAMHICNALPFDLFFDGFWTLFIIVPCLISLMTDGNKAGSLIGIAIGVILLLCTQDIINWKLTLPIIIIIIGIDVVFKGLFGQGVKKTASSRSKSTSDGGCAVFSGDELNFDGRFFDGTTLVAVFGGVECDLRNALIEHDCVIETTAIFGGVDIFLPDNVNVQVSSVSVFGGISRKKNLPQAANVPTVFIKGTCIFGGVDLK